MNDKEKEAIERLKYINMAYDCNNYYSRYDLDCIETVLNLIQTQQIKLENKDKIIDEMANELSDMHFCTNRKDCNIYKATRSDCKECIKQYFEYKVEEGK